MRRRLPWLLALPVMAAGSLAAHSLSYLFVSARAGETSAEASERASSGDTGYLVLFLGMVAATAVVVAAARLLLSRRGRRAELSPWLFFVLPPLAFALQELSERLLRAEAFPFHAALEPRFLLGVFLQLPFGLLAFLLARLLLCVVERLVRALAKPKASRLATSALWSASRGRRAAYSGARARLSATRTAPALTGLVRPRKGRADREALSGRPRTEGGPREDPHDTPASAARVRGREHAPRREEPWREGVKLLGINTESLALTILAVIASLALGLSVWLRRWQRIALLCVVGFGLVFAAGDARELVHQLDESNAGVASIAAILIGLHLGVSALAAALLPRQRSAGGVAVAEPHV